MNEKEDYYYDKINNLAKLNKNSINRFNIEVITKNMIVGDVLKTETNEKGNSYVNLYSPFIVRSTTVSNDNNTGALISNGGLSIVNGNIYILGEKNIYNFFQDSMIINNITSYEGINVKKNFKIKEISSLYETSNIVVNRNINNENDKMANIGNVIVKGSVNIGNKLYADNIISNGNIIITNVDTNYIYNQYNIITSNIRTRIGVFNEMIISNGYFYDMTINKLKNDRGNVDGSVLNTNEIYDYDNIYVRGNINTSGIIKDVSNISNIFVSKMLTTDSNIYTKGIIGNIITVSGLSNMTGTTRIKNNIDTKNIKINELSCSNLDILSGIPTSVLTNIDCSGNIIIYNLFDVRNKISTEDVLLTSYKDNLIPINLYDDFANRDSGYIYTMPTENVGMIYRREIQPTDYLNKSENRFILGKFDDNNKITGLVGLDVEDVYANIYGNSLTIGTITGNTFIGNVLSNIGITTNLTVTGTSIISNVYAFNIIRSNLNIDKTVIANTIYASYIDGPSTEISNIDPTNLTYTYINSEDFRVNNINIDGNLTVRNTIYEFTSGSGILESLIGNNINIGNTLRSKEVYTKNQVNTIDYSYDVSYGGNTTVRGNVYYTNYELSIGGIGGNYMYHDLENRKQTQSVKYINGSINIYYDGNKSIIQSNANIIVDNDTILYAKKPYRLEYDKVRNNYTSLVGNIIINEEINDIVSSNILIGIDCVGNNYVYDSNLNLIMRNPKSIKMRGTKTIGIYGNLIIVGNPGFNSNSGNASLYRYDNGLTFIRTQLGSNKFGYNVRIDDKYYIVSGVNYVNGYDLSGTLINQYIGSNNFGKSISLSRRYVGIVDDSNTYIYQKLTNNLRKMYNVSGNIEIKNEKVIVDGNIYYNDLIKFGSNNKIGMYDDNVYELRERVYVYNMKRGGMIEYLIEGNGEIISVGEKYMYLGKTGNLYVYK